MKKVWNFNKISNLLLLNCAIKKALREKCPNKEFFLVRIFLHSDWIRRDTEYISVFSPNTGKYGPEKTPCLDTFHVVKPIDHRFIKRFFVAYQRLLTFGNGSDKRSRNVYNRRMWLHINRCNLFCQQYYPY